MRRGRRGGASGLEFGGGSGADSFVAVVVTKLTGALLFILLLAMVIMALLPKAADWPALVSTGETEHLAPLEITTPESLPEAIAGRPYQLALAAQGGRGPLRWGLEGELPEGLAFDPETALISGTPRTGTPETVGLLAHVSDGSERSARRLRLIVYQAEQPLTTPSWWSPGLPPIPWKAWLEQGFGYLILILIHLVGMNTVSALQRRSLALSGTEGADVQGVSRRFGLYRTCLRLSTLSALVGLATWLWLQLG